MKILVTGGAGFIGSHMAEAFWPTATRWPFWTIFRQGAGRTSRRAPASTTRTLRIPASKGSSRSFGPTSCATTPPKSMSGGRWLTRPSMPK